jgi:hypothetical protein
MAVQVDVDRLLTMGQPELDALFLASPAGPIPSGEAHGTVLFNAGGPLEDVAAKVAHLLFWKGKVFDAERGVLRNEILPAGFPAIAALVYRAQSWLDAGECIVLDYSETSVVAHWVRDEIREVAPGIYLGVVFWDRQKILNFALDFRR